MWSIETAQTFPLASVKPLEGLLEYRGWCLQETRAAMRSGTQRRELSPVSGARLEPAGDIAGFAYARCPTSGSLFLVDLPVSAQWAKLLSAVSRYRQSAETFHAGIAQTRNEHVHGPKIDWIRNTLRMERIEQPSMLEVVSPPSDVTRLLEASDMVGSVTTINEMELLQSPASGASQCDVAVLFESLDRVDDPVALLRTVMQRLAPGGLMFVTSLVCSGFDMAVLGLKNLYLYPPDRTNCFTLPSLEQLLHSAGLSLLEVSTPGVLDVEIIQNHVRRDPELPLSAFERQLLAADASTREAFQTFLQQNRMSSFARIIGRKQP